MARPNLHLFSLPLELLDSLTPRNLRSTIKEPPRRTSIKTDGDEPNEVQQLDPSASRSCNVCPGVVFANTDIEGHRSHFRTDWHRYNVKSKLSNGRLVNERDFALLVESLEDSLSGSASSSSDEDSSESDAVENILQKTRIQSRTPSPTSTTVKIPLTAVTWFHCPPAFQLGVYRAIFSHDTPQELYLNELRMAQALVPGGRKWAMFMVAGGHFAGLVARVSKPADGGEQSLRGKKAKPVPDVEILLHKTFHRYTTRRKQGGSQSMNDNAKGNAKSAGAQLRRYGEQALRDDIRNLIAEWADVIGSCDRIWIRASGANRRIFMDYEEAIITKNDERLRTFPFPTRRPTQAELSRCLLELTKVKTTHFTEDELQAQDEEFLASLPKPKPPRPIPQDQKAPERKPAAPKPSKEEEILRDKWERLIDMIKKGRKVEIVKPFWEREGEGLGGVDAQIPEWAEERAGTLLQLAASAGQAELVAWLLDELNADPTIPLPSRAPRGDNVATESRPILDADESTRPATPEPSIGAVGAPSGRTAYDLASTRAVRDVFRRSAATRPDAWDWLGAAHIPSILNADMEAERDTKKKDRRKGLKDKIREREALAKQKATNEPPIPEPEPEPVAQTLVGRFLSGPQKLGGAPTANEGLAGLTPEMRQKIERERRARAAMARMNR